MIVFYVGQCSDFVLWINGERVKVKLSLVLIKHHAMMMYVCAIGGITPLFLDLCTRVGWPDVLFLTDLSCCPVKDETGHQIVPFSNIAILFWSRTKYCYPVHKWYLGGSHVLACTLHCAALRCGVWLLEERERFDICTAGKRKPIKIPKIVFLLNI
jgi:hypothetical protein